jgi:hypothetical protein
VVDGDTVRKFLQFKQPLRWASALPLMSIRIAWEEILYRLNPRESSLVAETIRGI